MPSAHALWWSRTRSACPGRRFFSVLLLSVFTLVTCTVPSLCCAAVTQLSHYIICPTARTSTVATTLPAPAATVRDMVQASPILTALTAYFDIVNVGKSKAAVSIVVRVCDARVGWTLAGGACALASALTTRVMCARQCSFTFFLKYLTVARYPRHSRTWLPSCPCLPLQSN